MRKFILAAMAFIAAAAGWWYLSPYWTLHQMQSAARRGDAKQLSQYIDYPAVREDLKGEIRRAILKRAATAKQNDGSAALGSAFALALIDPLVDAVITPQALEAAFARSKQIEKNRKAPKLPEVPSHPVIERHGLDRFTVRGKDHSKGSLLFARSGFGWRLVGFDLATTG
jgi:hypothetical protein